MKKILIKLLVIISFILTFFTFRSINFNSNYNVKQTLFFMSQKDQLKKENEIVATFNTTNIDWNGFNKTEQILPTWEADITHHNEMILSEQYQNFLIIYNANTTGLPNGIATQKTDFWDDIYFVAAPNIDKNKVKITHHDWFKAQTSSQPFDWNKENQNIALGFISHPSNSNYWLLSYLNQADPRLNLEFKVNNDLINPFHYEYKPPSLTETNIKLLASNDIELTYKLIINNGPSQVEIKANNMTIFKENIIKNGMQEFIFTPFAEYENYLFDFYLNDNLVASQSIKSGYQEATINTARAYQVKPNYLNKINLLDRNGLIGAEIKIDNPSNITLTTINFILKDQNNDVLATKKGKKATNDFNTYKVVFDKTYLASGNYQVDYLLVFNNNQEIGPSQGPFKGTLEAKIDNLIVSEPQIDFNGIEVKNYPTTPTWDNGSLLIKYNLNLINSNNHLLNANYQLIKKETEQIIKKGTLALNENILTIENLAKGNYYLKANINWEDNKGNVKELVKASKIFYFSDYDLAQPNIIFSNLTTHDWYTDNNLGKISGQIYLTNYQNIINKTIEITPLINKKSERSQTFVLSSDGIIRLENWFLEKYGSYYLELKVLDYQINSDQKTNDYLIGKSPEIIIKKHQFETPDMQASAMQNYVEQKLYLTFHATNAKNNNFWFDVDSFVGDIEVIYHDGSRQAIKFDSNWNDTSWNTLFPQVTFGFNLNKNLAINTVLIDGDFYSNVLDSTKEIKIKALNDSPLSINGTRTNWLVDNPGIIIAIALGTVTGLTMFFWPFWFFKIGSNKIKNKKTPLN